MPETFAGFPQSGLQFLRDLKANNDREWFRNQKAIYEEQLKRPMEFLVQELAAGCRKRGLPVFAKEKSPVMRIYRDIRFSSDKRPFHTHVGASLKPSATRAAHGELYIHISPDESFLAAGFWMPERPFLQVWREAMTRDERKMLRVVKELSKKNLGLSPENGLRRLPRGFDRYAGTKLADLLRLTSYVASRQVTADQYGSATFVQHAIEFALAAKPLLEYGWNLNYLPKRDILEER